MIKACDMNHACVYDLPSLLAGGFRLTVHKATQGHTFGDPKYHPRKLLSEGLIDFTGYHWLSADHLGAQQAAWFIQNAGELKIMPWIDFEEDNPKMSMQEHFDNLKACYDAVVAHYGRCGIYTGKWFFEKLRSRAISNKEKVTEFPEWIKSVSIWLADYPHKDPTLMYPWMQVVIHQCDDHLHTHGTSSHGDYDEVLVPLDQLMLVQPKQADQIPWSEPKPAQPIGDSYASKLLKLGEMCGCPKLTARLYTFMGTHEPRDVTVFDVSKSANEPRFHFLDIAAMKVTSITCGVGKGSDPDGDGVATHFSDESGSGQTPVGVFRYSEPSHMSDGRPCVRLDGLEASNAHMRSRAILLHTASYISDSHAGRSLGCEALAPSHADFLDKLANGSFGIIGLEQAKSVVIAA